MNKAQLHQRVLSHKTDVFPLDRMLPLETVYKFFLDEFNKEENKEIFVTGRKYQRLREGYFALFVGVFLTKSGVVHFMRFPEGDANDVDFLSMKGNSGVKPLMNRLVCDVKEYTEYSESFEDFVEKTVAPKIGAYHIIIGLRSRVEGKALQSLAKLSRKDATIWIVSSPSEEDEGYERMLVTMFQGEDSVIQQEVNLGDDLHVPEGPALVFEDILREKLT